MPDPGELANRIVDAKSNIGRPRLRGVNPPDGELNKVSHRPVG
jgi:hypothetical protein